MNPATDDIVARLRRLYRVAAELREVLEDAAGQVPARVDGVDRSGAIRVVLGPANVPESIEVMPDWPRRLRATAFGAAVVQAARAATAARETAWLRAVTDRKFEAAVDRLDGDVGGEPPGRPPRDPDAAARRDAGAEVRELLAAARDARASADGPAVRGVGSTGSGAVELVVTPAGLESCTADPDWVSRHSGRDLTDALSAALAAARDDLARIANL